MRSRSARSCARPARRFSKMRPSRETTRSVRPSVSGIEQFLVEIHLARVYSDRLTRADAIGAPSRMLAADRKVAEWLRPSAWIAKRLPED